MMSIRVPRLVRRSGFGAVASLLALQMTLLGGCSSTPQPAPKKSAVTGSFAFWPLFPDDPRIQFVRSFRSSEDVAPTQSTAFESLVFGKDAKAEASISKPYGVAMRDGKIYVCDMRSSALVVLDLKKNQTRLVGISGVNRLSHPVAVAVADDGVIYVADNERGAVIEFDAQERYARAIGFPKFKPVSLAVHGDRLYVCDLSAQAVQVFDRRSGDKIATIGKVGDNDGEFRLPIGIATDPQGDIYVVDMMRCRVQKFSPDGTLIKAMGTPGDTAGTFARPKHIAVDSEGIVYVVDASFQNVQMFDREFNLLMSFGAAGAFPGSMNLPAGICVADSGVDLLRDQLHPGFDARRLVVVTNQFGADKVSLYAMGEKREGYAAADLAKSAIQVSTGVGTTPERLRLQEAGLGSEPLPDAVPEPVAPESPAPAKKPS